MKPISDLTAFRMFNVDCAPLAGDGLHTNIVKVPLWSIRKRKLKRGERRALQSDDNARKACRVGKPGSAERLEAYAKFYAEGAEGGLSAFRK